MNGNAAILFNVSDRIDSCVTQELMHDMRLVITLTYFKQLFPE